MTSTRSSAPSASKPRDKTAKREQNPHYGQHNGLTQSLVVWAIREGRQAAHAVDKFLMGSTALPR
jgi:NADPH-dependent glutamate synthase beta subunit-like oxidoreductase